MCIRDSGNTIDSHKQELVYHFKLNENWASGSTNAKLIDANQRNIKDYSEMPYFYVTDSDNNTHNIIIIIHGIC